MLMKLSLVALTLLAACSTSNTNIRMGNELLAEKYRRDELVSFTVENQERETVEIYANTEVFDEGEWSTWSYGMATGLPESISESHIIRSGKSASLVLNFSKIEAPPIPAGQNPVCDREPLFRIRIVVVGKGKKRQELHSTPFTVVDPYGICGEDGRVWP